MIDRGLMKTSKLFLLLMLVFAAETLWHYPKLPDLLASHFDGAGRPNGWMPKPMFFGFNAGVMLLMFLIFGVMPRLLRNFPVSLINLPNKDYWLAESRREESFGALAGYLNEIGAASMILILAVTHLAIRANLARAPLDSRTVWVLLAAFAAVTFIQIARMLLRFGRRPADTR